MTRLRTVRAIVLATLMLMVAAACGQKPGVSEQTVRTASGAIFDPTTGQLTDPETGEVIGSETGFDGTGTGSFDTGGPSTTGTGTGTETNTDTTTNPSDDSPDTTPSAGGPPKGGDSTGVSDTTIKIGVHAPITGAVPVPSDSAERAKDIYWQWLERQAEDVFGRDVEVVLKNDNYDPSTAVEVCREMVERDKVFLLSGAAGTDQIQACASYAQSVGVPYLGAGVTERGLSTYPMYFATSMSYPDQGPLLADYLVTDLGAKSKRVGMLWFDTANFEDSHEAFVNAMKERGVTLAYDKGVSKGSSATTAQQVAQEMDARNLQIVNVNLSPLFFLEVLEASRRQGFHPLWTGVGIQMTFDTVAVAGCASGTIDGAKMFSPFPAWIDTDKYDPDFRRAVRAIYGDPDDESDDFMWLGWSGSKTLHGILERVGPNLTRERFVYFLERMRGLRQGIGPELNFSPDDHFGAAQVHVSEARCSQNPDNSKWHTIRDFVSDF